MSPTVPRDTLEGRIYNDLRRLAQQNNRDPAEFFTFYALEGFLARLALNKSYKSLVLKGGILMAVYSERRPTRDIDLSATGFSNDVVSCENRVRSILAIRRDDGLEFDHDGIQGEIIRDESDYSRIRIHVSAKLASANLRFHIDMNFGDPINPKPTATVIPLLLGGEVELFAYPVTMILAEKIVTMIDRGSANTRWRDFLDIAQIAETQEIRGDDFIAAIKTVSTYRNVELRLLERVLDGLTVTSQMKWSTWRKKQRLAHGSHESFTELLEEIISFADPVIAGDVVGLKWVPDKKSWS